MMQTITLPDQQKAYFISDFHLGSPDYQSSLEREKRIVCQLNEMAKDAAVIFLLGDIFDFWFEYGFTIPKGFVRLQGCLANIADKGIALHYFTGNHDMWIFDYLPTEIGFTLHREPKTFSINGASFFLGHGDGLGPGEHTYKFIKRFFRSSLSQWMFRYLPPGIGMRIAQTWSRKSRAGAKDDVFYSEKEFLLQYCREQETKQHFDYYIFGHRHLALDLQVNEQSRYINTGDWLRYNSYAVFDGKTLSLQYAPCEKA